MFRKTIIALAAGGLFAACAHTQEADATAEGSLRSEENAATTYATPDPVDKPVVRRSTVKPEAVAERAEQKKNVEPDNTGINKRDQNDKNLTPMDQSNDGKDLKITQEIRKAVIGADGLSFSAKNVKIITRDGDVTLRGPVKTPSEKDRIDQLARSIAGVDHVDNKLEVESTN